MDTNITRTSLPFRCGQLMEPPHYMPPHPYRSHCRPTQNPQYPTTPKESPETPQPSDLADYQRNPILGRYSKGNMPFSWERPATKRDSSPPVSPHSYVPTRIPFDPVRGDSYTPHPAIPDLANEDMINDAPECLKTEVNSPLREIFKDCYEVRHHPGLNLNIPSGISQPYSSPHETSFPRILAPFLGPTTYCPPPRRSTTPPPILLSHPESPIMQYPTYAHHRALEIFRTFERLCCGAARIYFLSQCDSAFERVSPMEVEDSSGMRNLQSSRRVGGRRGGNRWTPYPSRGRGAVGEDANTHTNLERFRRQRDLKYSSTAAAGRRDRRSTTSTLISPSPSPSLSSGHLEGDFISHIPLTTQLRLARSDMLRLEDYLVLISSFLWKRARASGTYSSCLEAVHRMGNLWAWGERIVRAARGEGEDVFGVDIRFPQLGTQLGREEDVGEDDEEDYGEGEGEEDENGDDREEGEVEISKEEEQELDQKVWKVMLSARDLTAWLLNEEAKREVEELWVNAWRCGDGREG